MRPVGRAWRTRSEGLGVDLLELHEQAAEAEVVGGGGGVHGPAFPEEELGLAVGALEHEHAGAPAQVQEGEKVGDLEVGEAALEDLLHDGRRSVAPGGPCYDARIPPHGSVREALPFPGAPPPATEEDR